MTSIRIFFKVLILIFFKQIQCLQKEMNLDVIWYLCIFTNETDAEKTEFAKVSFENEFSFKGVIFIFFETECSIEKENERWYDLLFLFIFIFRSDARMHIIKECINWEKSRNSNKKRLTLINFQTYCGVLKLRVRYLFLCNCFFFFVFRILKSYVGVGFGKLGGRNEVGVSSLIVLMD